MKMNRLIKFSAILLLGVTWRAGAEGNSNFEILASLDRGPGNVTVTQEGRIIMSLHQFYAPEFSVVEVRQDHALTPFPSPAFSAFASRSALKLDSVLGIRSDKNGVVWMLDNGMRGKSIPKLVGWNVRTDQLHRVIYLPPPVTGEHAFVNDFAVDLRHQRIFISDPAGGSDAALIVIDLATGAARRVLQGHSSVLPENVDLIIDGQAIQVKGASGELLKPHIGVNPITEDLNNEWVYYGPMHGLSLYRIKAADLIDETLTTEELASRVQRYSDKPISDGISIDKNNNIYLGDLANNAIGVIGADRHYWQLAQCPKLSWVDSFSFGPEGRLYAVVNRLHRSATLNGGDAKSRPPYYLLQVQALAAGLPGR